MFFDFVKKNYNVLFFVFSSAIVCGIVFMSIFASLPYMLKENGYSTHAISIIFYASFSYSCKFIISNFIKNLINKLTNKPNIIKILMLTMQITIVVLLYIIIPLTTKYGLSMTGLLIFLLTLTVSIQDITSDYVRLIYFKHKDISIAATICTLGFKIGMLFGSAGILYLAHYLSWQIAFSTVSIIVVLCLISTIFLSINIAITNNISQPFKEYWRFCWNILNKYGIIWLSIFLILYKFSDIFINSFKPIFLQTKGIEKIAFANISQILGFFTLIIGSTLAGIASYKIGTKLCIKFSFFLQIICSFCFVIIAKYSVNLLDIALLTNISTFFFGFTTTILRIYFAEESQHNVNTYTTLLSLGSMARMFILYIAGIFTFFSLEWEILFYICALSNILGLLAYKKILKKI